MSYEKVQAVDWLITELDIQRQGGPGVEPETAAMFGAILLKHAAEKDDKSPMHQLISETAEQTIIRREIQAPAAVSLFRTALINYYRKSYAAQHREFSDANLITPDSWGDLINDLSRDLQDETSVSAGGLLTGIAFRTAATPAKERIIPIDLLSQLIAERFPKGARGLDVGTSLMVGPLQLVHKRQFLRDFRFEKVAHLAPGKSRPSGLTDKSNKIVARDPVITEFVGIDKIPYYYEERGRMMYDRGNAEFALAGLRPSERNDPAYFGTVKTLMDKKQRGSWSYLLEPGVSFHFGDLLHPGDLEEFKSRFTEKFDVIVMSYITQELSPAEQVRMHEVACDLLSDKGLLVYLHQAFIKDGRPGKPAPISSVVHHNTYATEAWRSSMQVVDALNPDDPQGVQEMMTFYDNRCQRAAVKAGRLVINGELVPLSEAIRQA
jgi:hypothetical protein